MTSLLLHGAVKFYVKVGVLQQTQLFATALESHQSAQKLEQWFSRDLFLKHATNPLISMLILSMNVEKKLYNTFTIAMADIALAFVQQLFITEANAPFERLVLQWASVKIQSVPYRPSYGDFSVQKN